MRIGFYIGNYGGSPLTVGLDRDLRALGHDLDHPVKNPSERYDLLLVFNQCAHVPNYDYPPFPDNFGQMAFLDTAEYGYMKRMPGVLKDYWNAFAKGSVTHDTKNAEKQAQMKRFIEGRSFPYFVREFYK